MHLDQASLRAYLGVPRLIPLLCNASLARCFFLVWPFLCTSPVLARRRARCGLGQPRDIAGGRGCETSRVQKFRSPNASMLITVRLGFTSARVPRSQRALGIPCAVWSQSSHLAPGWLVSIEPSCAGPSCPNGCSNSIPYAKVGEVFWCLTKGVI